MNRCETITTEEGYKKEEMEPVRGAFRVSILGLENVTDNTKEKKKPNYRTKNKDYRSQVVIPLVEGALETARRVMKKCGVATAMRPHITLRRMLVHPKDKVGLAE